MLKIITTLTLFLVGILAKGQEVENRTVSSFSKVCVQNGIELIYSENKTPSLRIETSDPNIMKNIQTTITGNTLTIALADGFTINQNTAKISVYLATPQIREIKASQEAQVTISEVMNAENLKITLLSGARFSGIIKAARQVRLNASDNTSFNGKIESAVLYADLEDRAKINLTGKTEKASFNTEDTALLLARNFTSKAISIKASGKSEATINVTSNLAVDITDEANVTYVGFPDSVALNEEAIAFQKYRCDQSLTLN